MNKRLGAFVVGCLMTTTTAFAADMKHDYDVPLTPHHVSGMDWDGFYAGFNLGYGIGRVEAQVNAPRAGRDLLGAHYGIQAGYNFQYDQFVFGLEAGVSGAQIKGSSLCPNVNVTCSGAIETIADVKARFGVAIDNYLIYGAIGAAYGFGSSGVDDGLPGYSFETPGYALGVGAEVAVTENLSAKIDYSYIGFAQVTAPAGTINNTSIDLAHDVHLIKVGLNYHF